MSLQVISWFCHWCSLHLIPLNLNTLIIFCVQYKSKNLSRNFFHPPVIFSLSGPNILLSPLSETPAGCSSLSHYVRDQIMNCRINDTLQNNILPSVLRVTEWWLRVAYYVQAQCITQGTQSCSWFAGDTSTAILVTVPGLEPAGSIAPKQKAHLSGLFYDNSHSQTLFQ